MSNDDAPKDGEVKSFRTRRRTRRGKRRSLRVPVDEVPRRSAADDVSSNPTSDAPMPIHARESSQPPPANEIDEIEMEVTQPGTTAAQGGGDEPSVRVSPSADPDAFGDTATVPESDLDLADPDADLDAATDEEQWARTSPGSVRPPVSDEALAALSSSPPLSTSEAPAAAAVSSAHPPSVSAPPAAEPAVAPSREAPASGAPPPAAEPAVAPSREAPAPGPPPPAAEPAVATSREAPSSAPPPPKSAPPARRSSIPATTADGRPASYLPPPPGLPHGLAVPEPAAAEPAPSKPPPEKPRERRDSVVVRGTVRVSDYPDKRRMAPPAPSEPTPGPADAAPRKGSSEPAPAPVEEPLEELDAAELVEAESIVPAPRAPSVEISVDDEDALASEPTVVRARAEEPARDESEPAPSYADDSSEIQIEAATTEELGLSPEELELEIDEAASEDEEAEELELSETEAEELEPGEDKPRSHPPPMPPGEHAAPETAAKETAAPQAEPAPEAKAEVPKRRRRKPWWEDFFNDDYLRTVRPHPIKYVRRQVDFIEAQLGLERGATILDVGCGLGLHAVELAARGYLVVGLDLSLPMLSRAADEAQDRGLKINFLHGDMREMTFDGAFDAVLCWGTTLGYFDEETNRRVIERLYRALKPMGLLLIDAVNRDHVIRTQPNLVWFEGDGCVCMEETQFNYITSRLEVKRTVILDDGRQRENVYSIRLYSLNEIGQILHHQGFRVAQVSGQESHPGVFFGADSPRMIIMAERRLSKSSRDLTEEAEAARLSSRPEGVQRTTPKDGTARPEPPPPPANGGNGAGGTAEDEEIDELDIEPD